MSIDVRRLPQEIQDIIELKEATEQTFTRFADIEYTELFWNKVMERANPEVEHSLLLSVVGSQGMGKSMSAISICCALDPGFSADKIFFNYNDLVYNRSKILPNTAVLVDEQSELFGLDSHRVNIILQNLKEQLRKKSVHFVFCAPTLYPEHQTSMYILETMYIDFETREVYAALKTREGLTLGHVRIPHPLKILDDGFSLATEDLIFEYNKKKDEHLDHILGQKNIDIFEERANQIMNHVLFKKAERIYKSKMGYIPSGALIQLINKIFPEYMSGVVPLEIAGRIKLDKELSGDWEVAGKVTRRDRSDNKRRR